MHLTYLFILGAVFSVKLWYPKNHCSHMFWIFLKKNMVTNFAILPEFYPEVSAGAPLQQSLLPLLHLLRLLRLFCKVLTGKWGFQPRSQVT